MQTAHDSEHGVAAGLSVEDSDRNTAECLRTFSFLIRADAEVGRVGFLAGSRLRCRVPAVVVRGSS